MSNGVHRLSSDMGPSAHVAFSPGLADSHVLMVRIAHSTNRSPAFLANRSHFTARQDDRYPITIFRHDLCSVAGTSDQFSTLADPHFDIVNLHTGGNRRKRHRIANLRLTDSATLNTIASLNTQRRQNIPLFAISVMKQRDEAIPVRIVLNSCDLRGNSVFGTLKVNKAIDLPSAATAKPARGNAVMVSAAGFLYPLAERLLGLVRRQLGVIVNRAVSSSGTRWFIYSYTHNNSSQLVVHN
jgi:hypothetical protein